MHIGFFTDGYAPQLNGVATNLEAVTVALEEQGHRVSLFAPRMGDYVDTQGEVYRLPSLRAIQDPPLWLATPISTRLPEMLRLGLDIVHVHSPFSMQALGWQVARLGCLPLVSTYHTLIPAHVHHLKLLGRYTFSPRLAEWYSAWTCNLCDCVIAPSEKIKVLLEKYGVRQPISIIRNGIDVGRFQRRPRGFMRSRFGLDGGAKIMLSVGRLTPDKNFGFLVQVLARLVARDAGIRLALVGEGRLKPDLEVQAARLGVRRNLIMTGPVAPASMPDIYADADLFVNASFSETFSMTTVEAMAAGLPCVVVQDPALEALVKDRQNGYVVPPDADAFAARSFEIVSHPALHAQMSACATAAAQEFSVQKQAQELTSRYATLIGQKEFQTRRLLAC
jgi:1,2-diacylglycerol 3-alpha-glucosyltransferase